MNPTGQPPDPEPRAPTDSVRKGVLLAVLCQVGVIVATLPLGLFIFWGLTQWIVLLPLFFRRRRDGFPLAAKGILIIGFLGVLLNTGCAMMIWGSFPRNNH